MHQPDKSVHLHKRLHKTVLSSEKIMAKKRTSIYDIAEQLAARGVKKYFLQRYRPVESDKTSTDADCDRFFLDEKLPAHLRRVFPVFDVRR